MMSDESQETENVKGEEPDLESHIMREYLLWNLRTFKYYRLLVNIAFLYELYFTS